MKILCFRAVCAANDFDRHNINNDRYNIIEKRFNLDANKKNPKSSVKLIKS